MGTFLQIIGGLVLAAIVVLALLAIGLKLYLKFALKKLTNMAEMIGGPIAPIRIRLREVEPDVARSHPLDPATERQLISEFAARGFEHAGTYVVDGMAGLEIVAFANPKLPAYATAMHHPVTGITSEVVQKAHDGRTVTITTSKMLTKTRPLNKVTVSLPDARLDDLLAELKRRRIDGGLLDHTSDRFKEVFENAYFEDMKFQYEHGDLKGTDPTLVANMIEMPVDQETIEFLQSIKPAEPDVDEGLMECYLKDSGISALEWEQTKDFTVFIHDGMDTEDVASAIYDFYDGEQDLYKLAKRSKKQPRDLFIELVSVVELRTELLLHIDHPVPCDVHRFEAAVAASDF